MVVVMVVENRPIISDRRSPSVFASSLVVRVDRMPVYFDFPPSSRFCWPRLHCLCTTFVARLRRPRWDNTKGGVMLDVMLIASLARHALRFRLTSQSAWDHDAAHEWCLAPLVSQWIVNSCACLRAQV
eukprot:5223581-Pyramimonas_sp.AAC.1